MDEPQLTPEQIKILAQLTPDELTFWLKFVKNGAAGKHFFCILARFFVGLGILGGAIAGIISGVHAIWGLR